MRALLQRAAQVYRTAGPRGLARAAGSFVRSGELRYRAIGLLPATRRWIRWYVRVGNLVAPDRYTDADPVKTITIDPGSVTHGIAEGRSLRRFGRVVGGDWDLTAHRFEEKMVYRSLERRFLEGVPWSETGYYRSLAAAIERGEHTRAGQDAAGLERYFADLDRLHERIQTGGYKRQTTLLREDPAGTHVLNREAPHPTLNEAGVCIGRDGTFIHRYRGRHRLIIAQLLELESVPVQILARHRKWQDLRRAVRNGHSERDHPDLDDVSTVPE